jgi:hypothetical protein
MISIDLDFSARAMAAPFLHDDLRPETVNKLSKANATVSSEGNRHYYSDTWELSQTAFRNLRKFYRETALTVLILVASVLR